MLVPNTSITSMLPLQVVSHVAANAPHEDSPLVSGHAVEERQGPGRWWQLRSYGELMVVILQPFGTAPQSFSGQKGAWVAGNHWSAPHFDHTLLFICPSCRPFASAGVRRAACRAADLHPRGLARHGQ